MQFAAGHVFHYSARPGTPAVRLPGQVPGPLRKARSAELRNILSISAELYQQRFLGKTLAVLWESAIQHPGSGWQMGGHSDNYLYITASSERNLWNQVSQVLVNKIQEEGLTGTIWTH